MAESLPPELSRLLGTADPQAREGAWAAFVNAHTRLLLHTARTFARDYDAAMDAYAYILEALREDDFHRLRGYAANGRSKFSTWLVVVTRRLCLDHHRRRYGRAREAGLDGVEARAARRRLADLVAEQLDVSSLAEAGAGNPEIILREKELQERLQSALESLGPSDRLLLKLRFEDDLPAREIAAIMKFPTPFHVYRRLNVVLVSLRVLLARRGIGEPHP